ncbi:MAG TPA: hypothetical protein PLJ33_07530 [Peptococcaceae bacterium]|nr:hypothetical protein [Peptococcaceae bacterium]HPZ71073.1 hypothetical protein [Peptococcaceae bacterium]HQD54687.1 hypothetical protein [Peptococcaceae bacterium]
MFWMGKTKEFFTRAYGQVKSNCQKFIFNQRGDVTTVGILAWAAVVITLIVAAHGLLDGWLPDFIKDKIFDRAKDL